MLHYTKEEGRVDALQQTIDLLDEWLKGVETDTGMRQYLMRYAQVRGWNQYGRDSMRNLRLGEITESIWPRYKANYKELLYFIFI